MKNRLFYFGVLPALVFQVIGASLYFLWDSDFSQWIYTATKILLIVWPLLWLPLVRKNFPNWKAGRGTLLGIALAATMALLMLLTYHFLNTDPLAAKITEKVSDFNLSSPALYIAFAVFLSLFHSLLEEYYWRWFVFRGLMLKMNWRPAAALASAGFAAHHYLVLSEFFSLSLMLAFGTAVGIAGFIWCTAYYKTRSLLPSYLSHIAVDAVIMGVGYAILF